MQSLSVKPCMELRLPAFTDSKELVRIGGTNCRNCRGRNWSGIVSCGAERNRNCNGDNGSSNINRSSTFFCRSHNYAVLKHQMETAAKSEDYEEAARIRDSLQCFEEDVPVLRLRRLLKEAVADERFESVLPLVTQDAARYRDELKEISPHSLLKCSSDATTLGIRVQVRSKYVEGRSRPSKGLYFFQYRIRITNNSGRPVQLLRRHWIITDANGKTENVWGLGVGGEQPTMLPRTSFEYSSGCPLSTQNGRLEGDFEMLHVDRAGSRAFYVAIALFSLSLCLEMMMFILFKMELQQHLLRLYRISMRNL